MNTGALAISSLFVFASALVIPAWRNKRHAGIHADAVRVLSVLTLAAAVAATTWIILQVLAVGVHHTSRAHGGSMPGSVVGIPVVVIPLAILMAIVVSVEARIRADERSPVPAISGTGSVAGPATVSLGAQPIAVPAQLPHELVGARWRQFKSNEHLEYVHNEFVPGEVYSETVTAEAIAQIESRWTRLLEQQAQVQASTRDAVEELHGSVGSSATDTAAALRRVTEMCSLVTDGLEALRLERPVLVEAIALLAKPASLKPGPQLEVSPAGDIAIDEISVVEISVVDDERPLVPSIAPTPIEAPAAQVAQVSTPPPAPRTGSQVARYERSRVRTSVKRLQQRVNRAARGAWTRVGPATDPALTALRIRFARGEIDSTEYHARAAQLADGGRATTPPASEA